MFDWDGTLVDSIQSIFMSHNHVRDYLNLPRWTMEELHSYMRYSTREIYPQLYGDRAEDAIRELVQFSGENSARYVRLFDGTVAMLESARAAELPMGIVSNMRHDALLKQVASLGLAEYFKIIAGAGYADKDKPDPAPLIKALREMGLVPGEDILYVGDTVTDLQCARAAGCRVAFFHHSRDQQSLIDEYKPDILVANITEFRKIILSP